MADIALLVVAEADAAPAPPRAFSCGLRTALRRTATAGATVIHRLFHPLINMWQVWTMTDRPDQSEAKLDVAEIKALTAILNALATLDDAAQSRVLRWACDRYGVVA